MELGVGDGDGVGVGVGDGSVAMFTMLMRVMLFPPVPSISSCSWPPTTSLGAGCMLLGRLVPLTW